MVSPTGFETFKAKLLNLFAILTKYPLNPYIHWITGLFILVLIALFLRMLIRF